MVQRHHDADSDAYLVGIRPLYVVGDQSIESWAQLYVEENKLRILEIFAAKWSGIVAAVAIKHVA